MDYDFRTIESRWQAYWAEKGTFKTEADPSKPKFYVLDMFPYPSGAGNFSRDTLSLSAMGLMVLPTTMVLE